jgi:hypothetical protein
MRNTILDRRRNSGGLSLVDLRSTSLLSIKKVTNFKAVAEM